MIPYIMAGIGVLLIAYACYRAGYGNGVKDILEYMDKVVKNLDIMGESEDEKQ